MPHTSEENYGTTISAKTNDTSPRFKLLLLATMVLQNSSVVLIGRHTRASVAEDDLYVVNHLILVAEILKCILSFTIETRTSETGIAHSVKTHILSNPFDFLKILIPALLYLLQNTLLYVALSNLSAPLFQVTYQSKTLTTALVSVLLLSRRYTCQQWLCLLCLGIGVAIVVLAERKDNAGDENETTETTSHQDLKLGLLSVTIACFSSAIASVYFEKVIKDTSSKTPPPSLWMRNVQLAFFSIIIALTQNILSSEKKPFLHGFTFWVWALVILQAGGGLLVAAVIKYADNVLKGLATGVSVVLSTACSVVLFHTDLTGSFFTGAALILGSVYVFSNPIMICARKVKEDIGEEDEEIEVLVLKK